MRKLKKKKNSMKHVTHLKVDVDIKHHKPFVRAVVVVNVANFVFGCLVTLLCVCARECKRVSRAFDLRIYLTCSERQNEAVDPLKIALLRLPKILGAAAIVVVVAAIANAPIRRLIAAGIGTIAVSGPTNGTHSCRRIGGTR